MGTFYEDIRDVTANEPLSQFGQVVKVRVKGQGRTLNKSTGFVTSAGVDVDYATVGVVTQYRAYEVDGELIRKDDLKVLLGATAFVASGFVPTAQHALVIGGKQYEIVDVTPLSPGGVVVLYTVQARA